MQKLILLLLLAVLSPCFADDPDDPIVQSSLEANGHQYHYVLTRRMIDEEPAWVKSENPPLSCMSAERKAESYLNETLSMHGFHADQIALKKVPFNETPNKWYYIITFDQATITEGSGDSMEIYVLMDGNVVAPQKLN